MNATFETRDSPVEYPTSVRSRDATSVPSASAVSWAAILAGAAAAAALSLILLMLGTGLGLSSVSPWTSAGVSATTFGVSAILWVAFTQFLASGMGGYLAGRLRTRWTDVPRDEVYFRDTAHGFLAWAIASLATAALLTSVIGSIVSGGVQAGTSVAGGAASTAVAAAAGGAEAAGTQMSEPDGSMGSIDYFVDSLFRRDMSAARAGPAEPADREAQSAAEAQPADAEAQSVAEAQPADTEAEPADIEGAPPEQAAASTAEVARIFMNSIRTDSLPPEDARYVGQVVAERTGISQQEAEQRVRDTFAGAQTALREAETAAREAADAAREASAYAALWLFISLLIGAFIASFAATIGGRQRDL